MNTGSKIDNPETGTVASAAARLSGLPPALSGRGVATCLVRRLGRLLDIVAHVLSVACHDPWPLRFLGVDGRGLGGCGGFGPLGGDLAGRHRHRPAVACLAGVDE